MKLRVHKGFVIGRVLCGITLLLCSMARSEEPELRRHDQLKAAYLFNFIKFIEWPATASGEAITLCFVGGSGVEEALARGIQGKKVANRELAVRRLGFMQSTEGCSVLYLDAAAGALSFVVADTAMLTVSDARNFTRSGGMIELFTESNRLRFNVNTDNVQRAGLRISSSLLQLAASVEKVGAK